MHEDKVVLTELAHKVREIAEKPIQAERREKWRTLNSLKMERPMLNVNGFMWWDELYPDETTLKCKHPACRTVERELRQRILHDWLNNDTVIEPFVVLKAIYGGNYINTPEMGDLHFCKNTWGVNFERIQSSDGAWDIKPVIEELDDFNKMKAPKHIINEELTSEYEEITNDYIGDIIPVVMDRGPMIRTYCASLLHDLIQLRGYENVLYDLYENPEWLKKVLSFMTDGVLELHNMAERNGDFRSINTFNQTMTYCNELPDPSASCESVKRSSLWNYLESQEFDVVSPAQTDEFCIQYHKLLAQDYGLIAFGCCEKLVNKISILRQFKNLRIIAVNAWTDVWDVMPKYADQIGKDYVISLRPNPSSSLCNGFNADLLQDYLKAAKHCFAGLNYEINLKDVLTIRKDQNALKSWVDMAMDFCESY